MSFKDPVWLVVPFLESGRFLHLRFAALRSLSASYTPYTTLSGIQTWGLS